MTQRLAIFTSLPEVGGHTTTTIGLCKLLGGSFDGIEVFCKTMPGYGLSSSAVTQLKKMGCRVTMLNDSRGKFDPIAVMRVIARYLIRPASVFLTVGMGNLSPVLATTIRSKRSIYYHITHDLNEKTLKMLSLYARCFNEILFISPATYEDFIKVDKKTKVDWCLQGSDLGVEPVERSNATSNRPIRFGLMGRLTTPKGAGEILKFIDADPIDCEIHVVGIGEFASEFKRRAETPSASSKVNVIFHGSFAAGDRISFLHSFFGSIDWLIIPTLDEWESISMVLLESLQFGRPVLVNRTGGLKSLDLRQLGPPPNYVVCRTQPSEFAAEMIRIAQERQISDPIECVNYYRRYFSTPVVLAQWQRFFKWS